jgi:DNA-binding MarR family transcriptional regulator
LVFVYDNPGCGVGDVARYLCVAMTTIVLGRDRLVKKALVERRRPEDNRRAVALRIKRKSVLSQRVIESRERQRMGSQ